MKNRPHLHGGRTAPRTHALRAPMRAALLLPALLALAACKEPPPPPVAEAPAPIVQAGQLRFPPGHPQLAMLTTVAASAPGRLTVDLPARLVWNEERTQRIAPGFAGRVTAITADLGQSVKPGTVLARLASPDFGAAQADAAKAHIDEALTAKAVARQRELHEAGIVARKDLEQSEADHDRARTELARAQARVALYGGGAGVDQQLALRATMGGIVVERNLNPGQELRPEQSGPGVPPLFVISDPTSLWVQIDAREADVGTLRPGAVFELVVPTLPGQKFEGRVTAVGDAIDPATRTIKLRGVVDNPQRLLRAEMLAQARAERSPGPGVAIPASAVRLVGTQHKVYVQAAPGVFEPRDVTLSYQGPTQVVVARGLEVGERVVSDNLLLLARQFNLAMEEAQPAGTVPAASAPASGAIAKAGT